ELMPEGGGQLRQQQRMPAAERLEVGAVGQRALDLHEDVPASRLGIGNLLNAQVARPVVARSLHGVNTTFSARRDVKSSSPSANRSRGSTIGSGRSRSGSSVAASRIVCGVAEREPTTVSSRR